jgi:hypothetical protein
MLSHVVSCCLMLSHTCPAKMMHDCPLSHVVSCPADPLRLPHAVSCCLMLSHAVSGLILCAFDLPTCRRLSHAVPFSLIASQSLPWHLMLSHVVSRLIVQHSSCPIAHDLSPAASSPRWSNWLARSDRLFAQSQDGSVIIRRSEPQSRDVTHLIDHGSKLDPRTSPTLRPCIFSGLRTYLYKRNEASTRWLRRFPSRLGQSSKQVHMHRKHCIDHGPQSGSGTSQPTICERGPCPSWMFASTLARC